MSRLRKNASKSGDSKIRIIAGDWRSRKLPVLSEDGLRPTGDRMRETLFNWLGPRVPGARCLDTFAGTGCLGLESLSRGAKYVDFFELNTRVAKQLKDNLALLECTKASVKNTDALDGLAVNPGVAYDIIFVDPPFAGDLWQPTLERLSAGAWLNDGALIYVEAPKSTALHTPTSWHLVKQKVAGNVHATLFEYTSELDT